MDATDEFNSIHSSKAKGMLAQYYIGDLVTAEQKAAALAAAKGAANGVVTITANGTAAAVNGAANGVAAAAAAVNGSAELVALDPRKKIAFKLAEKIELSHNVRLFRFALQSPEHKVRICDEHHLWRDWC
jgi:nitrate reductase (NAD(P)H)